MISLPQPRTKSLSVVQLHFVDVLSPIAGVRPGGRMPTQVRRLPPYLGKLPSMTLWVLGLNAMIGCRSYTPDLVVTVLGPVVDTPSGDIAAFPASSFTIDGVSPIQQVQNNGYYCTTEALGLRIQYLFQDFNVVFGPNPGEPEACASVTAPPATFNLSGSWGFFWGSLPKAKTKLVVAAVPGTTGAIQSISETEHRIYLIGGGDIKALCNFENSMQGTVTLSGTDVFVTVNAVLDPVTGDADDCTISGVAPVATLPAADQDEFQKWKDYAAELGWDSASP